MLSLLSVRYGAAPAGATDREAEVLVTLDVAPDEETEASVLTVRVCMLDARGRPFYGLAETWCVGGQLEVGVRFEDLPAGRYDCYALASVGGQRFETGRVRVEVPDEC